MIELTRSEDALFVSWLEMRLGELGIKAHVLDGYTASAYGGALSGVRLRVMVDDDDFPRARRALEEAEVLAGTRRIETADTESAEAEGGETETAETGDRR